MEECIVLENEIYGDAKREIKKYRLKFIIEEIGYKGVNKIIKNIIIIGNNNI
jgi:hypothetical protein